MTYQSDKRTLPGAGADVPPPGTTTLPLGSGEQAHPDSFDDTIAVETPHDGDLSTQRTLATEALPPAFPGTLAAMATQQATDSGAPYSESAAASPSSSLDQTTVLPRVELEGATARVLVESRLRYETLSKLGEGGMGEVMNAQDHDIGRRVAIKRLRARMRSPLSLARFVEEIRTTGRLEHPNVVPIHDVGVDDNGEFYFVMKRVDGETLESIIQKLAAGDRDYHQRYGYERRVEIFKGVLEAVNLAHSEGIIHRDIKPANIMVGAFGEVVLMDWGLAKSLRDDTADLDAAMAGAQSEAPEEDEAATPDATRESKTESRRMFKTQAGALLGTPAYMAPEQAVGEPADERSDIYALSVMFHELLTLKHYLSDKKTLAQVLASVSETPVPMAAFVKSPHQGAVPADLHHFVKVGVAKDPALRYQSVQAMLDRLDRRAEGDIPIECPMTAIKSTTNRFTKLLDSHPFVVLGGLLLGVLGGVSTLAYAIVQAAS
jgi:eukaryotic-like serine/threonine-protein kinase